jgi:hypothetical protein
MNKPEQAPSSPLDAMMYRFLGYVQSLPNGFMTGAQFVEAAAEIDLPDAMIEALFTSASTRGLIGPDFNARGRTRWILSARGKAFLKQHSATAENDTSSGEPRGNN